MQSRADVVPVRRQRPVHRRALRALSRRSERRSMPTGAPSSRPWPSSRATCWPKSAAPRWAPNGARVIGAVDPETLPSPANRNVKGNGKANGAAAPALIAGQTEEAIRAAAHDTSRAFLLIRSYRIRGHLEADLDPLGLIKRELHRELDPATYGFSEADWDRPILIFGVARPGRVRDPAPDHGTACARPTAARSASSTCTSPIPTRRRGSRSASSTSRTTPSSPSRAAARSCERVDRGRGPRAAISASSSSAPSASASTAANR